MSIPEISVTELHDQMRGNVVLLDVREEGEWEEVRAIGTIHIPLGEIPERAGELPAEEQIHIICRSGARSLSAAEFLATQGLEAINVAGGTNAWVQAGLPTESGP